jgi:hypothetical protein
MEDPQMRINILAVLALTLVAAISISNVTATTSTDQSLPAKDVSSPILRTMQAGNTTTNETVARLLVLRNWNNFVENFDQQSKINNDTARGNISYGQAMILSTSLLVLNSQALSEGERIVPGEKYSEFHKYTLNSMRYFNIYLYNIAKLFETRQGTYARNARDAFNASLDNYTKGKEEADFLF